MAEVCSCCSAPERDMPEAGGPYWCGCRQGWVCPSCAKCRDHCNCEEQEAADVRAQLGQAR